MKLIESKALPISAITVANRLRAVDPAHVEAIMASMGEGGLRQAIQVAGRPDGSFLLMAGAHRLEAAKGLGWDST